MDNHAHNNPTTWYGTTILSVRKNGKVVIAGDGQVSMGQTVMKPNARKVRQLHDGSVIGGFAGATADAFTLFERLERKLEQHRGQLMRAAVDLAKDWRTDKYLRNLEAMMIVADKEVTLILTGNGDVLEPNDGIAAIGALVRQGKSNALTAQALTQGSGFVGVGGIFRLRSDGTNERGLAIAQIRNSQVVVIDPAPRSFGGAGF